MKTENEFNAWLGKHLRMLEPKGFFTLKVAEKYHIGVSDFFIWHGGQCASVEVKFIKSMPLRGGNVLKHEFDGKQQTFLKRVSAAGNPAWGLIAVHDQKKMVLIPNGHLPESGNWKGAITDAHCFEFSYGDWKRLAYQLFGKEPPHG